jgi:AcrR family transcriptional regulator
VSADSSAETSADTPPAATAHEAADRGARARERLLAEALRIFADKGYAKASTREICHAAGLNVAAIHYHFGGKEGLYSELLLAPFRELTARFAGFDDPALSLPSALRRLLGAFMLLGQDADNAEHEAQMMRLHRRETVEPTFGYAQRVAQQIKPHHEALALLLARHTGAPADSDRLQHLAFALVGLAQECAMQRGLVRELAPCLLNGSQAADEALERLVDWGCAMVEHEWQRRDPPSSSESP